MLGMKVVWLKLKSNNCLPPSILMRFSFPLMMRSALLWPRNTGSDSRLKIIPRPNELLSEYYKLTRLDLLCADHYRCRSYPLGTCYPSPPRGGRSGCPQVELYLSKLHEDYDSLVSVKELKNFLLNKYGVLINNTTDIPWPRTQDLEVLYEINHAVFLAKRDVYVEQKNRIGKKPLLYLMDELHSKDVDWEEDFTIAEMFYKKSVSEMKVVTFGEIMLRLERPIIFA